MVTYKLDLEEVRMIVQDMKPEFVLQALKELQIVIYVMIGGGITGYSAVTSPANFYLDKRSGCPYKKQHINQCVEVLKIYAEVCGLDPYQLKFDTKFHSCGVF
jgi:hypothetical protein